MSTTERAFDEAVGAWLARQRVAEERLTSFAFREGQPDVEVPAPTSHAAIGQWIAGLVADRAIVAVLRAVEGPGTTTSDLAAAGVLGLDAGDRVALVARVGVLAAAGLVTRELETDRVSLTELGRAALAVAVERSPAAPAPAPSGAGR